MKKKDTWIKPRHTIITKLAYYIIKPYTIWKYGIHIETFKEQRNRPYLILANHQTPFDQFFVALTFDGKPIYYMATEDIFSLGFLSTLLKWAVAPIPIRKQTTDLLAVKNCIKVAKEGGTIAIFPEGNRTYSGQTEYMSPTIASLAKKLRLPIAFLRIEGGYGIEPRWSDEPRKGKMKCYVSKVLEPEEYKELTNDELFAIIEKELYVNEACLDTEFHHPKRGEYLERLFYVCPHCGLTTFESQNHLVTCKQCGSQISYETTKEFKGINQEFPFRFVLDWYNYQKDYMNQLDVLQYTDKPLYEDTVALSEVIVYKQKNLLRKHAKLSLYGDKLIIDKNTNQELILPFTDISAITVLGKNKLNVYYNKMIYQIKADKRFNAVKYVHIFNRHNNVSRGDIDGKFLGL